jgi:hypothetical protein
LTFIAIGYVATFPLSLMSYRKLLEKNKEIVRVQG